MQMNAAWAVRFAALLVLLVFGAGTQTTNSSSAWMQTEAARRNLSIYFIDVEGGAATLIVTPAGESVLLDAGWGGFDGRDAKRIKQAMQQARIKTIDHLVTSHYHMDHYGGVPELSKLVPIQHFYDHGKMTALSEDPQFAG